MNPVGFFQVFQKSHNLLDLVLGNGPAQVFAETVLLFMGAAVPPCRQDKRGRRIKSSAGLAAGIFQHAVQFIPLLRLGNDSAISGTEVPKFFVVVHSYTNLTFPVNKSCIMACFIITAFESFALIDFISLSIENRRSEISF